MGSSAERAGGRPLIVYDSVYGNTEKIAKAIYEALGSQGNIAMLRVGEVKPEYFEGLRLFIIGSPTQRFRPTAAISNSLKGMSCNSLTDVKVAAFDTRLTERQVNETPVLPLFVRLFGQAAYAAKPLADTLKKKGGERVIPPGGFYVEGMQGPLVQGEWEGAMKWARQIGEKTS